MRTPEELENYFMSSNRGKGNSLSFKDFIAEIIKPDYNNWEGKEEYEARFMEILEKRF